jgi:hypothetical protein
VDEKTEIRYARLRRRETTQKRATSATTAMMIHKIVIQRPFREWKPDSRFGRKFLRYPVGGS